MQRPGLVRFLTERNTALIIIFLVAWVVALDLLWYLPTRQSLERAASDLSLEIAASAAATVEGTLQADLASAQNAAADIRDAPTASSDALTRLIRRHPAVLRAALVDQNGAVLESAGSLPAGTEPDYSKLPGVYAAFAGAPNFGNIVSLPDGTPISYVVVPVDAGAGRNEVLVAAVSFASLKETITAAANKTWRIYLTDKSGAEIIGPDPHVAQQVLLRRPIVQKVVVDGLTADGLAANDSYVNEDGLAVFVVGQPIPIANWSLFVERPAREALSAVSVITWLAIAIVILGAAATILALTSYWRLSLLTDRLRAQRAELEEKNKRLEELDRMKSEFLSIAAHQLRTPLSALKWTLEAVLEGDLDAEQRSTLLKGNDSNERMIRLVDDMLAVTRIEAGKVRYAFVPLHIEDVVDNLLLDFVGQARAHNLALTFERPVAALPYIFADPERMRDILGNLIENAIRYTLEGGAVTIRTIQDGAMIKISVTDTGIGIPPDQQKNIFNKFFRADNAAKVQTDGSGLGLFIAKATVERHGGKLWFESALGRGTTFFFTVPVHTVAASAA